MLTSLGTSNLSTGTTNTTAGSESNHSDCCRTDGGSQAAVADGEIPRLVSETCDFNAVTTPLALHEQSGGVIMSRATGSYCTFKSIDSYAENPSPGNTPPQQQEILVKNHIPVAPVVAFDGDGASTSRSCSTSTTTATTGTSSIPIRRRPEISVTEEAIRNMQKQEHQALQLQQQLLLLNTTKTDTSHHEFVMLPSPALPDDESIMRFPPHVCHEYTQYHPTLLNHQHLYHQNEYNSMRKLYYQNQVMIEKLQQQQQLHQHPFHSHLSPNTPYFNNSNPLYHGDTYYQRIIPLAASQENNKFMLPIQQIRRRRRRNAPKQSKKHSIPNSRPLDEKLQQVYDQSMLKKKQNDAVKKAPILKRSPVDGSQLEPEGKCRTDVVVSVSEDSSNNDDIDMTTTSDVHQGGLSSSNAATATNTVMVLNSSMTMPPKFPATKRSRATIEYSASEKKMIKKKHSQAVAAQVLSRLSNNDVAKAVQCIYIPPPIYKKPILVPPPTPVSQQQNGIQFKPILPKTATLTSIQRTTPTPSLQQVTSFFSSVESIAQMPTLTSTEPIYTTTKTTAAHQPTPLIRSKGVTPTRHVAVVSPPNCDLSHLNNDYENGSASLSSIEETTTVGNKSGSSAFMMYASNGSFSSDGIDDAETTDWISTNYVASESKWSNHFLSINNDRYHNDSNLGDLLSMEEILSLSDTGSNHSHPCSSVTNLTFDDTSLLCDIFGDHHTWDDDYDNTNSIDNITPTIHNANTNTIQG